MKTRQLIKRIAPEKLRYFLRPFNYYTLFIYSCCYLKRTLFDFFNRPFRFPLQQTITNIFPEHVLLDSDDRDISRNFRESGFHVEEGRHCLYLSKENDLQKIMSSTYKKYPDRIGIKVIKSRQISPDNTPYYASAKNAPASNFITMRAVGSTLQKIIISNILSLSGCAPRVYDLVYFKVGEYRFFGLIVQHIEGEIVSGKAGELFIEKFRAILKKEHIETVAVKENKDFQPPEYNNNILADSNGTPTYVDIQNFEMLGWRDFHYPQKLLKRFDVIPCFPDTKVVKRKEISYMNAQRLKRKIQRLNGRFVQYLTEKCFKLKESIIFDIGYPIGLMTGFALSSGAAWSYILDMDDDGKIAERYLFENGFSRFELIQFLSKNEKALEKNRIDCLCYSLRYGLRLLLTLTNSMKPQFVLIDTCFSNCEKDILLSVNLKLKENGFLFLDSDNMGSNNAGSGLLLYQKTEPLK